MKLEWLTRPHKFSDWKPTKPASRYCKNCYKVQSQTGADYDVLPLMMYNGIIESRRCSVWTAQPTKEDKE